MKILEKNKFSRIFSTKKTGSAFVATSTFLLISSLIFPATVSAKAGLRPLENSQNKQFDSTARKQSRGRVPGRRRGGARRGTCAEMQTQLVALVPATEVETETLPEIYVGGVTTAEYPTVWFDVPYALTNELTAEFVLQDDRGQDIYSVTSNELFDSATTPGMLGISLPETAAPLVIGTTYQWYFKVDCGSETPPYVQGGIERVALTPELADQLAAATPLEQAAIYQQNEIWYDAIAVLSEWHLLEPDNATVKTAWTALWRSLDLGLSEG